MDEENENNSNCSVDPVDPTMAISWGLGFCFTPQGQWIELDLNNAQHRATGKILLSPRNVEQLLRGLIGMSLQMDHIPNLGEFQPIYAKKA